MNQKPKIQLKSKTSTNPQEIQLQILKIIVLQDNTFPHDQSRSKEFEGLFENLITEMQYEQLDEEVKLELVVDDGKLRPQNWRFEMKGQRTFEGKSIRGYIKFPNDYPVSSPRIYFDFVNKESLFHANIYGDGRLCIPLLANWRGMSIDLKEMIQAMKHIFENPNIHDPANPQAAGASPEVLSKKQKEQAQHLLQWE